MERSFKTEFLYIIVLLVVGFSKSSSQQPPPEACLSNETRANDTCRSMNGIYQNRHTFEMCSCYLCYSFMDSNHTRSHHFKDVPKHADFESYVKSNKSLLALLSDADILRDFLNDAAQEKWRKCCNNAVSCCEKMIKDSDHPTEDGWCPRTWDGWLCWPDTPPDSQMAEKCPTYSSFESCTQASAVKVCTQSGQWASHPDNNREWTNYLSCSGKQMMERRLYVSLGSFATSVVCLIPALIIFQKYRTLQCHRIILHKNLFASLLFYCSCEIIFTATFVLDELGGSSTLGKNLPGCKALLVATMYFRVSNYMWMFCEGYFLHHQIVHVFAHDTSLNIFYAIGWGFPIIPVVTFIILRKTLSDTNCWALPSDYIEWTLHFPCLLSLVVNMFFLARILFVLITNRPVHGDERGQFRKAARATLVLVPLFGLHFLLTIYRHNSVCTLMEEYYMYLGYLVDGLQGAMVAIIFCYINSEVMTLVRRSWRNIREERHLSHLHSTYNGTTTSVINSQAPSHNVFVRADGSEEALDSSKRLHSTSFHFLPSESSRSQSPRQLPETSSSAI